MGDPNEFGGGPPDDGPPDGFFGDDGFDDGYGPPGGNWGPPPGNLFFLHSMEKKSTKVDFSPISCKKAPFYTRNGHF